MKPIDTAKLRKGLVCLVPRQGMKADIDYCPITSHEKTFCDCQVLEILDAYEQLKAKLDKAKSALEFLADKDERNTYMENVRYARQALKEIE